MCIRDRNIGFRECLFAFKIGNSLTKYRYKIAHDMSDRVLDTKNIRIQIPVGYAVSNLSGESNIKLILGNRIQHGIALISIWKLRIVCHICSLNRYGNLVNLLPWPFEIWSARQDYLNLGIGIPLLFILPELFRNRIIERRFCANALRPAENRLHRTLILVHNIKPAQNTS